MGRRRVLRPGDGGLDLNVDTIARAGPDDALLRVDSIRSGGVSVECGVSHHVASSGRGATVKRNAQ